MIIATLQYKNNAFSLFPYFVHGSSAGEDASLRLLAQYLQCGHK